jgi:hypothetical protein
MTYEQAQTVKAGDRVRSVTGREGAVLGGLDSGLSVHFTVYTATGGMFEVHSANCYRVEG